MVYYLHLRYEGSCLFRRQCIWGHELMIISINGNSYQFNHYYVMCHGNMTTPLHKNIIEKGDMDMKKRILFFLRIKRASP